MKIIVVKRTDDFMAYQEGHKEIWGCGATKANAVGDLILSHASCFGIDIEEGKL